MEVSRRTQKTNPQAPWRQPTSATIKSEAEKKIRAAHAELSR